MHKAFKALPLNPKLINVKSGNYFKGYVSNLTHNQKNTKQKQPLRLFEKKRYFIFKVKEFSFHFLFKNSDVFNFFLCISNNIFPYSWNSHRHPKATFA